VLTVTDNNGATGKDTVTVTVNLPVLPPSCPLPPVADAGTDQTITLPVNTTVLLGRASDPDGFAIASYTWTKIAGPTQFTIASPTTAHTALNNLEEGVYTFELKATDNVDSVGRDTVRVTVKRADSKSIELTNVYPNPATSIINIQITAHANVNKTLVKIYTNAGLLVYSKEITINQTVTTLSIDVSKFTKGSYFVQIIGAPHGKKEILPFMKL
jgi:hypothetical protein